MSMGLQWWMGCVFGQEMGGEKVLGVPRDALVVIVGRFSRFRWVLFKMPQ